MDNFLGVYIMTAANKKQGNAITTSVVGERLTMDFSNGEQLHLSLSDLSPQLLKEAALHGLKQKLADGAALKRDEVTGRAASIDDKFQAVKAIFDRLTGPAASWNAIARTGEGSGGLLFRAILRLYPKMGAVRAKAWLDGKTDKEKAALRVTPQVAAMIDTLRAESGQAGGVDAGGLLDELADME
jgi:hypothetical protein